MKRFFLDACLTLLVVILLSAIVKPTIKEDVLLDKVATFEDQIATNQPVQQMVQDTHLNTIAENKAGQFAEMGSEFVISILQQGQQMLQKICDRLF